MYPIALLLLVSCSSEKMEVAEKEVARPVKLITTKIADELQVRRYPAAVDAALSRELSFNVSGLIEDITVKESHKVDKNVTIAKLDQSTFQSKVEAAKATFETSEKEYQRGIRLQKGDAISKSDLEKRKSQKDIAKAELEMSQKALNDTILKAPFAGVVSKVEVTKLQNIQAGEAIITLFEENRLQATINLPASVIATSMQRKEDKSFVIFEAAPNQRIPAVFQEAKLEADTTTQTFEITFSFQPPENLITLPGMNAMVEIVSSQDESLDKKNGVSVPLGAILSDGQSQYVWLVNIETMAVSKRKVTVLPSIGENVVVTEGLSAGDTIAGAGASYLTEGMKVRQWSL